MKTYYLMVLVMSGLSLLFYLGGLVESNPLIDLVLSPQTLDTSGIWLLILTGISSITAIVIGVVTKNIELSVMTAITPPLFTLLFNFIVVFQRVYTFSEILALLIFGPIFILFVLVNLDYWRSIV